MTRSGERPAVVVGHRGAKESMWPLPRPRETQGRKGGVFSRKGARAQRVVSLAWVTIRSLLGFDRMSACRLLCAIASLRPHPYQHPCFSSLRLSASRGLGSGPSLTNSPASLLCAIASLRPNPVGSPASLLCALASLRPHPYQHSCFDALRPSASAAPFLPAAVLSFPAPYRLCGPVPTAIHLIASQCLPRQGL